MIFHFQELDQIDFERYWDPRIVIANIQGSPEEDLQWHSAKERSDGNREALMFYRRRIRAKFSEVLELHDFPVDAQV